MLKPFILLILTLVPYSICHAQNHRILSENIASLQVNVNDDIFSLPILNMYGDHVLNISFDELSHDYHRYKYSIEHMEHDWSVTESLFKSDYLEGMYNDLYIDDFSESLNTAQLYSHYKLRIPNENVRIKMSGNYCLTVTDDNNGDEVLKVMFMVVEPKMTVGLSKRTNTDIDVNKSHQQIDIRLNFGSVNVTDPANQIHTTTIQNSCWRSAVVCPAWQISTKDGLQWNHCKDLIFEGGNEYRKFEFLDLHRNSLGIDHTSYDGEYYNVWLITDEPRPNYTYDEDADGAFIIRNTYDSGNDTESEYVNVHFTYRMHDDTVIPNGKIYIEGKWTNGILDEHYLMEYNRENDVYECSVPMKMGYYSYRYVLVDNNGNTTSLPTDGSFFQTQNTYSTLVYFRPIGGRTDLLMGYGSIR